MLLCIKLNAAKQHHLHTLSSEFRQHAKEFLSMALALCIAQWDATSSCIVQLSVRYLAAHPWIKAAVNKIGTYRGKLFY